MARRFLYVECGSVKTKALVVEVEDRVTVVARGEALTTAGFGLDDVSHGILQAVAEMEESLGTPLLQDAVPLKPHPESGLEGLFVTSSVAGATLAAVAGVFRDISAESAQRAALLGGACVSDVFAINDERLPHEKRVALRQRPIDMLILAGGVDDFTSMDRAPGRQAVTVANLLSSGLPRSRVSETRPPTVVYAGSVLVRDEIKGIFDGVAPLEITENVRPKLENENLEPARTAVRDIFRSLLGKSPRYGRLGTGVDPAGYATGRAIEEAARRLGENILFVDVGGAFTSVYSSIGGALNRTVTDLWGLVSNGATARLRPGRLQRWLPFPAAEDTICTVVGNRMIRPQTVPETWEELAIRLAIVREEARLGLQEHMSLAVLLRGIQRRRQIYEIFGYETVGGQTIVNLSKCENIILGGGWLAGRTPNQIMMIATEALETAGANRIYADTAGLLPFCGELLQGSEITPDAVLDSLELLGTCVSPLETKSQGGLRLSSSLGSASLETVRGRQKIRLQAGRIQRLPLETRETAVLHMMPARGIDFGDGPGKRVRMEVKGGPAGVILDMRPRPLSLPSVEARRLARLIEWWKDFGACPSGVLAGWEGGGAS
ncbi:MAG: glutamate mutase L [Bacillota bacterium]|nr:glutamate mutase L [Bacillota bacterium]